MGRNTGWGVIWYWATGIGDKTIAPTACLLFRDRMIIPPYLHVVKQP